MNLSSTTISNTANTSEVASIAGIHHITAIASDPVKTVMFYTEILGLRLVKKSVNQDDVATYHLFFGDKTGEPGMDLTFFTFQPAFPGVRGRGQVTMISFAVPVKSLDFWLKRFEKLGVKHEVQTEEWDRQHLVFFDDDNQRLELVGVETDELQAAEKDVWTTTEITKDAAIRSFYSAKLSMADMDLVAPILTEVFGYQLVETKAQRSLWRLPNQSRAAYLEVVADATLEPGIPGAGTVHHIAFRVKDETHELQLREALINLGLYPTEVINRYYFKSVYFRTPAGILFELATDGPGFTADESEAELGKNLALPPFLEPQRTEIEAGLTPI